MPTRCSSTSSIMSPQIISVAELATLLRVSIHTIQTWVAHGRYPSQKDGTGAVFFYLKDLQELPPIREMLYSSWFEELETKPLRPYTSIELFAGGGGLALGMEKAGFKHIMLNEIEHDACQTLRANRPQWDVIEGNVRLLNFSSFRGKVDLLTGGFPCQAFSYAGNKGGFADTRGTLFFELARAIQEIQPRVVMCENVRGLLSHDKGRTLEVIKATIGELGYHLFEPKVLHAVQYQVPQKRERLILIAVRNDLLSNARFSWPAPYHRIMNLRDAFYAGDLYPCDVPQSEGQRYPEKKQKVMSLVPMGGNWRDLPAVVQKEYMAGSLHLPGGETGIARRLSLDEPSLTLVCAPAQKQTERCHPIETRPLTLREYARIQTFPDAWQFSGSLASQYKQIGNAVPVNLAYAIGRALVRLLNSLEKES